MSPKPWRAAGALFLLILTGLGLATGVVALRARHRRRAATMGALAIAISLLAIVDAAAAQGDNLGVAGLLSGTLLRVLTLLPLASIAGIPLGATLLIVCAHPRPTKADRDQRVAGYI